MDKSFEVEVRDAISVLTVKRRERGLSLTDPGDMQRLWSILDGVSVRKQKVLLIIFDKDVFAPHRVDEAWSEIVRADSSTRHGAPQIRALRSNLAKLIDYYQRSRVLTIGAFSGQFDLDLFGLLSMCNYRICTADSTIENRTLDRPAPPGAATVWFLSRLVGFARANAIYLDGQSLSAQEARDFMLVNDIARTDDLRSLSEKKAEYFASKSSLALATLTVALNNAHLALPDYLSEIGTGFESAFIEE